MNVAHVEAPNGDQAPVSAPSATSDENRTIAGPVTGAEPRAGFAAIGRVLGAWGVHGALRLEPLTDFPERFALGAWIWLAAERRQIERSHWQRGTAIVKLSGIDAPEAVRPLQGVLVELPESELHSLGEDEYYQHDLLGLTVHTTAGEDLGRVAGLLPTGANDVLIVRGSRGEYLLPLIADVVRTIDLEAGAISVDLIDGLEPVPQRRPDAGRQGQNRYAQRRLARRKSTLQADT